MPKPKRYEQLPNFTLQSANGASCALTNLPLQKGEDFVVRLWFLEGIGGFDVRPGAIKDLAVEALGMVPAEDHLAVLGRLESAESLISELEEKVELVDETLMSAVNDLMEYLSREDSDA